MPTAIAQRRTISILAVVFVALVGARPGRADVFIGSGPDGLGHTLQAEVAFRIEGSHLVIDLTNTGTFPTLAPQDVLTAVYFDITGKPALSGPTAVVAPGSVLFKTPAQTILPTPASLMLASTPGGWDYKTGGKGGISQYYGFGAAGLDRFAGGTSSGGNGGPGNYGIAQAVSYDSFTGYLKNTKKSTDATPLVQDTVEFTLSGLSSAFQLSDISHVRFQYGTSTSEPSFSGTRLTSLSTPEPSTVVLAALGALGFLGYGLRRRLPE